MIEWQPIETAPKDGTEILAFDPVADKCDVCYMQRSRIWSTQSDGEYGPDDDEFQATRATHWMPLPKPPVTP